MMGSLLYVEAAGGAEMRVPSDSLEPAQPVSYLDLDPALPTWVVLQLAHLPCPEMVLAGHSHSSPGGCL